MLLRYEKVWGDRKTKAVLCEKAVLILKTGTHTQSRTYVLGVHKPLVILTCMTQIWVHTVMIPCHLTAHGRQIDPALPDGNCLFHALSNQLTGDPSRHPELREILTTFISQNPQVFGRGWTLSNCSLDEHPAKLTKLGQYGSHTEIKAAARASLYQKPIYVATDSLSVSKCM